MKIYVRVFIVSLSWFILINFISAGASVYAAAAAPTVPFGSLSSEAQDIFRTAVERFIEDLFAYNNYDDKTYSYTSPDGTVTTYTKPDLISDTFSAISDYVEGVQDSDGITSYYVFTHSVDTLPYVILDEFCSLTHKSSNDGRHGGSGRIRFSASDYSEALDDVLKKTALGSLSIGIDLVNGVPQNVSTIKQDPVISAFDNNYINYGGITSSLGNLKVSFNGKCPDDKLGYYGFFCILDGKLYTTIGGTHELKVKVYNRRCACLSGYFNVTPDVYSSWVEPYYTSFGLTDKGGIISSWKFYSFIDNYQYGRIYQYIFSFQTTLEGYPILDNYEPEGYSSADLQRDYQNLQLSESEGDITFYNPLDLDDNYTGTEILSMSKDIITGYVYMSSNNLNSNLKLAASEILYGDEFPVVGGDQTILSDLSSWQKGIYLLAQQQGMSYSDMLQTGISLVIDDNGEMSLEDSNGILYNLSELVNQYDEIIGAVGNISGDLSELLEYLKSLNLEGLESYIAAIEGTLNDLNERDKDNSAVLGDCLGTLNELKDLLDDLNLEGISSDVHSIANSISHAMELEDVNDIQGMDSSFIIDKFPFSLPFDLYHIVTLFVREPVKPIFTIPIETEINAFGLNEEINEEIVLDLTMFQINGVDIVQAVLRFSIIVGYVIMLLKLTTRFFV